MGSAKKVITNYCALLALGLIFLAALIFWESQPQKLSIYFFNVGQGDSALIRTPARLNILIDGGPDNAVLYKLGKYLPFYDRQIDLLILTHPHDDHVAGLVEVLKRYTVKKILMADVSYQAAAYRAWLELIREKNISMEIADRRGFLPLDEETALEILFPVSDLSGRKFKNINNTSIVLKLINKKSKVLFMGDFENEEDLIKENLDLSADILKIGHHGSANANSFQFLKSVKPACAVIEVGKNSFGHPRQEVIDFLIKLGAAVLRTDQMGDIIFIGDRAPTNIK